MYNSNRCIYIEWPKFRCDIESDNHSDFLALKNRKLSVGKGFGSARTKPCRLQKLTAQLSELICP